MGRKGKEIKEKITMRPAETKDCRLLWKWRNDPETRRNSFNTDYIPYKTHKEWFEKSLKSRDRVILIAMRNNTEIGEIRFDVKKDKSAEIDVCVAPEHRGKGFGSGIIKEGTMYALNNLNTHRVLARIKKGNERSVKAFSNAGFKIIKKDKVIIAAFYKDKKYNNMG